MSKTHRSIFRSNVLAAFAHKGVTNRTVKAYYQGGNKHGQRIQARTLRNWLEEDGEFSPTLDGLAGLAAALEVLPWQLLLPNFKPGRTAHTDIDAERAILTEERRRLQQQRKSLKRSLPQV